MTKLEQAAYDEALRLCALAQKRTARDKRTIARLRSELEVAGSNERARIVAMLRREAATYDVEETENVALRHSVVFGWDMGGFGARGCAAGLTAWDVTDEYAARLDGGE